MVSKSDDSLTQAKKALFCVKPRDIQEIRGMRVATDTTKLVFDALQLCFCGPMNKPEPGIVNMLK